MRKVLFWGRMLPTTEVSLARILADNLIASNSGNLIYQLSVARAVMTKDTQLVPFYSEDIPRLLKNISRTNAEYDCAIIPLANAFRKDFIPKLRMLTRFVREVRFSCVVIGVGIQAHSMDEINAGFSFDNDVRDFVKAILDRSATMGLRGGMTAAYLSSLGFIEDKHYSVIGCPSLFLRGEQCRAIEKKPYEEISSVSFNANPKISKGTNSFLLRCKEEFPSSTFVVQDIYAFWSLFFPYRRSKRVRNAAPSFYPVTKKQTIWKHFGGGY